MSRSERLRSPLAAFLATLLFACNPPPPPDVPTATPKESDLRAEADELYSQREELDRVREGIVLLRRARTLDERDYEALWRLSRFSYYLAENAADAGERESAYVEGITAGRDAVEVGPPRPEGHYWLGANLAGRMSLQGVIGDLAAVGDVRREMEAVIKADEGFQSGGAYVVLAEVELELPRMLGGDKRRAVELLERGLRFGEGNPLLRLRLAESYLAVRRREDARRELQALLDMRPHPDFAPEHRKAVAEARRLLEEKFR